MARSDHQLGRLAEIRGHHHEAARQYQRALAIDQRIGDRAGKAIP